MGKVSRSTCELNVANKTLLTSAQYDDNQHASIIQSELFYCVQIGHENNYKASSIQLHIIQATKMFG